MDNAKEFHSHALVRGAQEYGIEVNYRPVLRPHYGGHIERLIGTTMGAVHLLPGTTFSNVQEKGSYNSEKEATMTMAELERWLALEIGDTPVRPLLTPNAATCGVGEGHAGARPTSPSRKCKTVLLHFLPGEHRLIRRDGIRLFNIHYMSDVLTAMAGRSGKAALIKYDPRDLSKVYLRDNDGHYWEIPYRDLRLPPISLWELQAATKQFQAEGRSAVDVKVLFEIAEEQRHLAEGSRISTRDRRAAERRRQDTGSLAEDSVIEQNRQTPDAEDGVLIEPFGVEEWSY